MTSPRLLSLAREWLIREEDKEDRLLVAMKKHDAVRDSLTALPERVEGEALDAAAKLAETVVPAGLSAPAIQHFYVPCPDEDCWHRIRGAGNCHFDKAGAKPMDAMCSQPRERHIQSAGTGEGGK